MIPYETMEAFASAVAKDATEKCGALVTVRKVGKDEPVEKGTVPKDWNGYITWQSGEDMVTLYVWLSGTQARFGSAYRRTRRYLTDVSAKNIRDHLINKLRKAAAARAFDERREKERRERDAALQSFRKELDNAGFVSNEFRSIEVYGGNTAIVSGETHRVFTVTWTKETMPGQSLPFTVNFSCLNAGWAKIVLGGIDDMHGVIRHPEKA